jgi:pyruvate dehydrogenase E2 component (dihydrolipoyllysine-residue acetyltransferase)
MIIVATILSMPKWGLAMKNGRVVEWIKHPGDAVQEGEPIVEIESEKAANEVESPANGTLRWVALQEGESAPVMTPIAVIVAPGEELSDAQVETLVQEDIEAKRQQVASQAARVSTAQRASPVSQRSHQDGGRVNASPAARRLAQELGVDLTTIVGTGPRGMIGREDVLRAAEERKQSAVEAEEHDIAVDEVRIHYLIAGPINAPHVVLIHGIGGTFVGWSLNLPALAQQFRVCALDLVGAGMSEKPERDYSVPALAVFVMRFLDTLGEEWQRASFIGHSLGAAVALSYAQQAPERVERLVLVDSAGLGKEIDPTLISLIHSEPSPDHVREELASFFMNTELVLQALVDQTYQLRQEPSARAALIATADASFKDGSQLIDMRAALEAFPRPVLVTWGAMDRTIPVQHTEATRNASNVTLHVFPDCGHCPYIERSDEFNQLVAAFLS